MLEERRPIVEDEVDSGPLMEHLHCDANASPTKVSISFPTSLEALHPSNLHILAFVFEVRDELSHFRRAAASDEGCN